jgi:hypothetical protein
MCYKCKKEWKVIPSEYPCGPCPDKWKCPECGTKVSPCCGEQIIDAEYDDDNEVHQYCGTQICSNCGKLCHCGGCI